MNSEDKELIIENFKNGQDPKTISSILFYKLTDVNWVIHEYKKFGTEDSKTKGRISLYSPKKLREIELFITNEKNGSTSYIEKKKFIMKKYKIEKVAMGTIQRIL